MADAQGDLFADPPAQPGSPTSRAAADEIRPVLTRLRRQVLELVAAWGPVTDEAIATRGHLNPSTERPRRIECLDAGWIIQRGEGRTASGRRAAQWMVTAEGMAELSRARRVDR